MLTQRQAQVQRSPTTTDDRVEITPELLEAIQIASQKAVGLPWRLGPYRGFGGASEGEYDVLAAEGYELTGARGTFGRRANAELCILLANSALALVARIRELESEVADRDERALDVAWDRDTRS